MLPPPLGLAVGRSTLKEAHNENATFLDIVRYFLNHDIRSNYGGNLSAGVSAHCQCNQ